MKHSKSSQAWLREHHNDVFVRRARDEGFRARSVFKLSEIDQKYHILKPGMSVVDLGAAPGGWCQYAIKRVGKKGRLIALDILPMPSIANVEFIQGDFIAPESAALLGQLLADQKLDVVLSDMAPNMSGVRFVDQARSMELVELALDFAKQHLKVGGDFLVKVFQGAGQQEFLTECRKLFSHVFIVKPEASRARSHEVYFYAQKKLANKEV